MPKSSTLSITLPSLAATSDNAQQRAGRETPGSSPVPSPALAREMNAGSFAAAYDPHSPMTSLPPPQSPKSPKASSRSLFANKKASKSSTRLQNEHWKGFQTSTPLPSSPAQSYPYKQNSGSTPELSLMVDPSNAKNGFPSQTENHANQHEQDTGDYSVKASSTAQNHSHVATSKRGTSKHRFTPLIKRSKSSRDEDSPRAVPRHSPETSKRPSEPEIRPNKLATDVPGMKAAPLDKDRTLRDMMSSNYRNRSSERQHAGSAEDEKAAPNREKKDMLLSSSAKEGSGANFFSNIRNSSTKAADGLGKAGKGILGKLTRSGSSHEKEPYHPEDNYNCRIINLRLVEQTRRTRISKRLEDSKDKTEFWMPALPWRCIDFLNMKGCEQEGLYRVPGSGREVKRFQMRFDTELDIDLFNETDLYDINIIGSMFKNWLRELPDEILPKSTQARIAEQCAGAKATPQLLKDELSKLPPFNYYLLFAITCHISLLHSCSKENKMDYRNLCICFQPCMKIDAFCFQWLVLDWRNCWQGCWTEKEYLAKEIEIIESKALPPPTTRVNGASAPASDSEERNVSSSGSSKPSITSSTTPDHPRPPPLDLDKPDRIEESEEGPEESHVADGNRNDDTATPTQAQLRSGSGFPAISPMKPLSPLNL